MESESSNQQNMELKFLTKTSISVFKFIFGK
jgi:hypothetical protein